jgi:hypothetical protein
VSDVAICILEEGMGDDLLMNGMTKKIPFIVKHSGE